MIRSKQDRLWNPNGSWNRERARSCWSNHWSDRFWNRALDTSACHILGHCFYAFPLKSLEITQNSNCTKCFGHKRFKFSQYWSKSNHFHTWPAYISMPHLGPLLPGVLFIIPRNLIKTDRCWPTLCPHPTSSVGTKLKEYAIYDGKLGNLTSIAIMGDWN